MHPEIHQFTGIPYKFESAPIPNGIMGNPEVIDSVNCQRLIHELYQSRFGIQLPSGLWSAEMLTTELFVDIPAADFHFLEGDIFFFGTLGAYEPKKLHLAYHTGQYQDSQSLLIHATYRTGDVTVWDLPTFTQTKYPWIEQLVAVRRLDPELHRSLVLPVIYG